MKQEATKIAEKLESLQPTLAKPLPKPSNKRIKKKIDDLNRKIWRAKGKTKRNLIAKRDVLKSQLFDLNLSLTPKLVDIG